MGYKCIIPAGGFGVRLGELTKEKPKALLPIGDITILDHIYEKLCELPDLDEICIVVNDKFKDQFENWINQINPIKPVLIISDGGKNVESAKGAIKGTWYGIEEMGWYYEDILIMGSDNFIPLSLTDVNNQFVTEKDSVVVVCDYKDKDRVKKLIVPEINDQGYITYIEEKPQEPRTTLGCPLIYFIKSKDVKYIFELTKQEKSNIGHVLELIQKKSKLKGYLVKNHIIDIGTFTDYVSVRDIF